MSRNKRERGNTKALLGFMGFTDTIVGGKGGEGSKQVVNLSICLVSTHAHADIDESVYFMLSCCNETK